MLAVPRHDGDLPGVGPVALHRGGPVALHQVGAAAAAGGGPGFLGDGVKREEMGERYLGRPLERREEREGGRARGGGEAGRTLAGTAGDSRARTGGLLDRGAV